MKRRQRKAEIYTTSRQQVAGWIEAGLKLPGVLLAKDKQIVFERQGKNYLCSLLVVALVGMVGDAEKAHQLFQKHSASGTPYEVGILSSLLEFDPDLAGEVETEYILGGEPDDIIRWLAETNEPVMR